MLSLTRSRSPAASSSSRTDEWVGSRGRAALGLLLTLAGLDIALHGQLLILATSRGPFEPAAPYLGIGVLLALVGTLIAGVRWPDMARSVPVADRSAGRWHWLGMAGLSLGAVGGAGAWGAFAARNPQFGTPLWIVATCLVLLGAYALDGLPRRSLTGLGGWLRANWREATLLVVITAAGTLLRFWRLDQGDGVHNDAAWNGIFARAVLNGLPYVPYESWNGFGHETPTFYLISLIILVTGPTFLAIRLSSAIVGSITLVPFYFMARRLFGPAVAAIGTALLAGSMWHVLYSRSGWRASTVVLAVSLVIWTMLRAHERRRWLDYALFGLALTYTFNSYDASRAIPAIAAGYLGLAFLPHPVRFVREQGRGLLVTALASAVSIVPIAQYAVTETKSFFGRAEAAGVFVEVSRTGNPQPIVENATKALLTLNYQSFGDFANNPPLPLYDAPTAVVCLLGVAALIAHLPFDRRAALLGGGIVVGLLPAFAAFPTVNRLMVALPFIVLGAAALVWSVAEMLRRVGRGRVGYVLALLLLGAALVWPATRTWSDAFGPAPILAFRSESRAAAVARALSLAREKHPDDAFVVDQAVWNNNMARYLFARPGEEPIARQWTFFDAPTWLFSEKPAPISGPTTVAMYVEDPRTALHTDMLLQRYAGATADSVMWTLADGITTGLTIVRIPDPGQRNPVIYRNGLMGVYYPERDWQGQPIWAMVDPLMTGQPGSRSIEWVGEVETRSDKPYMFRVGSAGVGELWIDGQLVIANRSDHQWVWTEKNVTLEPGWHAIRLRWSLVGDGGGYQVYWHEPGVGGGIIPVDRQRPGQDAAAVIERVRAFHGGLAPGLRTAAAAPAAGQTAAPPRALPAAPPATNLGWKPLRVVDRAGDQPFRELSDLVLHPNGTLVVSDRQAGLLNRFDEVGTFLASNLGLAEATLAAPQSLALAPDSTILVLDEGRGSIERFDGEGRHLGRLAGPDLKLYSPRGLSVASDGLIYVADTGNARVLVLRPDGSVARQFGTRGGEPGQMIEPVSVGHLVSGQVAVYDGALARVTFFAASGEVERTVAVPAHGHGNLTVVGDTLYLTAAREGRVLRLDTNGVVLGALGAPGDRPGELKRPVRVVAGADGSLWVADAGTGRLQHLQPNDAGSR